MKVKEFMGIFKANPSDKIDIFDQTHKDVVFASNNLYTFSKDFAEYVITDFMYNSNGRWSAFLEVVDEGK